MLLQVEGHSTFGSGSGRKPKAEPRDHVRENVHRMRQIQRASRQREGEKQVPVKALWKSTRYEGVQSRVKDVMEKPPPTPRPHTSNFLRSHSRTGYIPTPVRPCSTEPPEEKLTVPSAEISRQIKLQHRNVDFIKVNGKAAKQCSMRRSPSLTALDDLKTKTDCDMSFYERGAVPKYLQSRKKQWEQEEEDRRASIPDPDLPEGHRVMPNNERLETLEKLKMTETELLSQVNSMPIRTDTPRVRARKDELDKKLCEVDEAIRIFSRRKVFVRLDA